MSIWTPRVSHSAVHCVAVGVLWYCAKLNIPPHTILISMERMQTYQISHFWDFFCFHEFPNWIRSKLFLILIIHIYCIARCARGERQYEKRNSFDSLPPLSIFLSFQYFEPLMFYSLFMSLLLHYCWWVTVRATLRSCQENIKLRNFCLKFAILFS